MGKIKIKAENKGKFTAWASAHGMTVQQAAAMILRNREKYSPTLIKRANFARNAAKWEEGGMFMPEIPEYKSGGIHINPKNKGKFNATKKATGKSTEELTHSKNPKTRKRAIFAQNAKKWKHGEGGIYEDPNSPTGVKSSMSVNNNYWVPQTRTSIYYDLAKAGKLGTGTDSLTYNSWNKLSPQQTLPYMDRGAGFDYTMGNTANPGGVKYWKRESIGDAPKGKGLSKAYFKARGKNEYGMGGVLSSLGGVASAIPGPWGKVAGAGLGLIGGIIGGAEQQKEEEQALAKQRREEGIATAQAGQAGAYNPYPTTFKIGGTFKGKRFGGKPNAEVEGGEVLITPDGSQTNVGGPSHAQGGVDVNLPNNTMILSDKVKIGKGQSAADAGRPYTSKINKAQEVIKGNATKLAKQSAGLNLNKYYAKVLDAYNKQEAKKFRKGGLAKFQDGDTFGYGYPISYPYPDNALTNAMHPAGPLPGMFPSTTQVPYNGPYRPGVAPISPITSTKVKSAGTGTRATAVGNAGAFAGPPGSYPQNLGYVNEGLTKTSLYNKPLGTMPTNNKLVGESGINDVTKPGPAPEGFDWVNAASSIGEMAPMLYNLGQGLFGKREQMRASDYNNPYEGQINSLMANRRYNIDPELAANENAFRTTAANMRNLGGSRGQVMSNLTGAQNTKQFGDMSAYAQKKNMENQYAGEYAQMLYPMGRDRSNTRMMVDEANSMTRASGRNMTGAAMTGLQQYLLTRRQMKNQSARDKLLGSALQGYSKFTNSWIPGFEEYLNKR